MSQPRVTLPPLPSPLDQLWHVLMDLSEQLSSPWTIVGGQMVLLHALEHRQHPPQLSQDGDVVADVRATRGAVRQVVAALSESGFTVAGMSPAGLAHRYERPAHPRPVVVDVLAPEGLRENSRLLTTTPPGRTVQVPGGTQALARTEIVEVVHEGRVARVPRPSLLAALVLKGAATGVDAQPARHLRDLALLSALVPDPFAIRAELTAKDRQRLRAARTLAESGHPAWLLVPEPVRAQGHEALMLLIDDGPDSASAHLNG